VLVRENYRFSLIVLNKRDNSVVVFDKTTEGIQLGYPNNYTEDYLIQYETVLKNVYYNINILSETQKNIINSHTEDDNPFIIKYNFRK